MGDKNFYPLDFSALEKGGTITLSELKDAIEAEYGTTAWNFGCLALLDRIEHECGYIARVVKNHTEIQILTDSQAEAWTRERFKKSIQSQTRQIKRRGLIDVGELSENERRVYDQANDAMIRIAASSRESWRRSERLLSARSAARKKLR